MVEPTAAGSTKMLAQTGNDDKKMDKTQPGVTTRAAVSGSPPPQPRGLKGLLGVTTQDEWEPGALWSEWKLKPSLLNSGKQGLTK